MRDSVNEKEDVELLDTGCIMNVGKINPRSFIIWLDLLPRVNPEVTMNQFSQVFIFTDRAPDIIGKIRGDMIVFATLCIAGIGMFLILNKIRHPILRSLLDRLAIAGGLIGGLFLAIFSLIYLNTLSNYRALQDAYTDGIYNVAEGIVSVSHVQPPGCDLTGDLISIDDVEFEVNYCHGAPFGYNQTIKNDGVLTEGANARVYYMEGKTILRVDIKQ